ncbi:LytR/AlgR family response regulator transcription factor [Butyrivibrio sp. MC2021]|uniref:LytR/AlgR family response regulator transcription factor n=1 Tax=Butyrivibrio sp. MC2021 TaxID=1408306 RepID=UPI00047C73C5|nr:LytTR family DNA-binding domain-containing protein [Butyrivibrio sp. MC2021]
MYKVAICDDEEKCVKEAAALLEDYNKTHPQHTFAVDVFMSSIELLGAMEKENYDIYLLDIYIDKMNGIEIADLIRKKDEEAHIVFMTSSNAFYKDAFRIHAVHYLEKPILKEDFFDAMDRACQKEDTRFLTVKDGNQVCKVAIGDVLYVESEDHYKRIATENDTYMVRSTLKELMDELTEEYFYALGVKSIINLTKVLRITKDTLVMEDGKEFSVPRGTYRTLSELIIKHSF